MPLVFQTFHSKNPNADKVECRLIVVFDDNSIDIIDFFDKEKKLDSNNFKYHDITQSNKDCKMYDFLDLPLHMNVCVNLNGLNSKKKKVEAIFLWYKLDGALLKFDMHSPNYRSAKKESVIFEQLYPENPVGWWVDITSRISTETCVDICKVLLGFVTPNTQQINQKKSSNVMPSNKTKIPLPKPISSYLFLQTKEGTPSLKNMIWGVLNYAETELLKMSNMPSTGKDSKLKKQTDEVDEKKHEATQSFNKVNNSEKQADEIDANNQETTVSVDKDENIEKKTDAVEEVDAKQQAEHITELDNNTEYQDETPNKQTTDDDIIWEVFTEYELISIIDGFTDWKKSRGRGQLIDRISPSLSEKLKKEYTLKFWKNGKDFQGLQLDLRPPLYTLMVGIVNKDEQRGLAYCLTKTSAIDIRWESKTWYLITLDEFGKINDEIKTELADIPKSVDNMDIEEVSKKNKSNDGKNKKKTEKKATK